MNVEENEEVPKSTVEFSVSDCGVGIPAEVQNNIFQPFYQADNSVRRRFGGSGKILEKIPKKF